MKEPGEAIKIIKRLIANIEGVYKSNPLTDKESQPVIDALIFAVSALKKHGVDKCCETCKHKKRSVEESPCCDCYMSTAFDDSYEPYTEEES